MFGKIYWTEVKKATRLKTIIIMSVIALILAIVFGIAFGVTNQLLDQAWQNEDVSVGDIGVLVEDDGDEFFTEEQVAQELEILNYQLESAKKQKKESGYNYYRYDDEIYKARSEIAVYEYIRDNQLYNKPLAICTQQGVIGIPSKYITADQVAVQINSLLSLLVIIYGAIVAGSIFADEFKQGTIKLLLLRPVSRNELTTAKLLATLTHALGAYVACFLLAILTGYIGFPVAHVDTIFSFNAGAITVADNAAYLGILFACGIVKTVAYAVVSFALGAMTRNKVLSIITPIFLLSILSSIFDIAGLGRFFIADAVEWSQFVGVGYSLIGGSDFFISLVVGIVYMAGLIFGTYYLMNKKDIV